MIKIFNHLICGLLLSALFISGIALAESNVSENASVMNATGSSVIVPNATVPTGNVTGPALNTSNVSMQTPDSSIPQGNESRNVSVNTSSVPAISTEWNGTVNIFHIATIEEQNKTDSKFWKIEGVSAEDQANLSRLLTSYPDGSKTLMEKGINTTGNGFIFDKKMNETCTGETCERAASVTLLKTLSGEVSQSEPWVNGTAALVLFPVDTDIPREMLNRENKDGAFPFFVIGESSPVTGKIEKDGSIDLPCSLPNVTCSENDSAGSKLYAFQPLPAVKKDDKPYVWE